MRTSACDEDGKRISARQRFLRACLPSQKAFVRRETLGRRGIARPKTQPRPLLAFFPAARFGTTSTGDGA